MTTGRGVCVFEGAGGGVGCPFRSMRDLQQARKESAERCTVQWRGCAKRCGRGGGGGGDGSSVNSSCVE